jgi:hypothetical protein
LRPLRRSGWRVATKLKLTACPRRDLDDSPAGHWPLPCRRCRPSLLEQRREGEGPSGACHAGSAAVSHVADLYGGNSPVRPRREKTREERRANRTRGQPPAREAQHVATLGVGLVTQSC